MLTVVGTLPYPDVSLLDGIAQYHLGLIRINGVVEFPVQRGTAALIAGACEAMKYFGGGSIRVILAGDRGRGDGSREIYRHLVEDPQRMEAEVLVFHYLFPDVDWHGKIFMAVESLPRRPFLVADAGFMYVAKMSGYAGLYDLFTPDVGELAFLADEEAPHPFYTRGFIIHEENNVPALIKRAYDHNNAARYLLVKATVDYIVAEGRIVATVSEPNVPELEAVGGTGDTLTGIVSSLLNAGFNPVHAMILAAKANRLAGEMAKARVDSPITDIIDCITKALEQLVSQSL